MNLVLAVIFSAYLYQYSIKLYYVNPIQLVSKIILDTIYLYKHLTIKQLSHVASCNTGKYFPRCSLTLPTEKPMFSGAIDKQHWTVMGKKKFKSSSLSQLVKIWQETLHMTEKRDFSSQRIIRNYLQNFPIFVTSLLLLDVINE